MSFALVLAGGDSPDRQLLHGASEAELVIAADFGVKVARAHGLSIHLVVGDMDSVSNGDVAWAKAEGAEIIRVPQDKDFTDLELALDRAADAEVERILVMGVEGGRIDHELGNWAVLCAPRDRLVEIATNGGTVTVLHGALTNSVEIGGSAGDLVSILAKNGEASGVTTTGLRWPLHDATILPTSSLGVSNEFAGDTATVSLTSGTLLVARPSV